MKRSHPPELESTDDSSSEAVGRQTEDVGEPSNSTNDREPSFSSDNGETSTSSDEVEQQASTTEVDDDQNPKFGGSSIGCTTDKPIIPITNKSEKPTSDKSAMPSTDKSAMPSTDNFAFSCTEKSSSTESPTIPTAVESASPRTKESATANRGQDHSEKVVRKSINMEDGPPCKKLKPNGVIVREIVDVRKNSCAHLAGTPVMLLNF